MKLYQCMFCKRQFISYPKHGICDICGTKINDREINFIETGRQNAILIKISKPTVLESMREKGNLWFQSPKVYQTYTDNDAIGDINECAFEKIESLSAEELSEIARQIIGKTITDKNGNTLVVQSVEDAVSMYLSKVQYKYRLLCFYKLELDEELNIVVPDERMKKFGTHFSIISNRNQFVTSVGNYVEAQNYPLTFLPTDIAYISDKYRGVYTPGIKFNRYTYQNEYRFILDSDYYLALDEMQHVEMKIDTEIMKTVMSPPIPINMLYEERNFKELIEYLNDTYPDE